MAIALALQVDDAAIAALERIATAQMIMAVVMLILCVIALGGSIILLLEGRYLRKVVHGLATTMDELKPRLIPLLDRARHVTDDVSGMTDNIRRRVDDVLHTVEDIHRDVKRGNDALESRVRRFGAVLDVVQAEAEELLLDAAATARGVHETARLLREPGPSQRRSRRQPAELGHEPGLPMEDEQ